ncbi:MAG TPA: heat-inducible transcriptional repressor HrcA [Calditrichia bacterium]|nr:heat-inducible transcription repressor HrcA [Calditrichota bacterium]HQU71436.1 heat-inducible transcriptional repressor HrcA [Calditrichia bacterium]HQV30232.1 heat-inducible transcriptional repressor HrcA [Calditrichia bacterium]
MTALTQREKLILNEIVQHFIDSAAPVSSNLIARKPGIGMSAATIRSIMNSLEQKGFIAQPHTSAGRVPCTSGYRVYVDELMRLGRLTPQVREEIRDSIESHRADINAVLKEIPGIVARLARQLSLVMPPALKDGVFQRMEMISLSSERLLVIITITSGMMKTLTLEIDSAISRDHLDWVTQIFNERLSGIKLSVIRSKFSEIISGVSSQESSLIRLFKHGADRLFNFSEDVQLYFMGAHYMMQKPDFTDLETVSSVIEMVESRHILNHMLPEDLSPINPGVPLVRIGEELDNRKMQGCSLITAQYRIGEISGAIGILGPMRMDYGKLVALLDYTAKSLTGLQNRN